VAEQTTSSDTRSGKKVEKLEPVMEELRNYTVLMDKYSLHNFVIYEGKCLFVVSYLFIDHAREH
jgi:hypothetical protein